jgi:ABC-2 type transport system permease protein
MFRAFFDFELSFWLRSWTLWIFFSIISLSLFGAASSDMVVVGSAIGNTFRNAPWVVESYYATCGLITLLFTTAFVNAAALRDFSFNTSQLVFSTPIRKGDYLGGRFLGAALIALIPLLGVSVGVLVAKHMPWVEPNRWGPVVWMAHLKAILLLAIPNTLLVAAIIFAIAVLTRSTVASFLGALLLIAGYETTQALATNLQNEKLAALLDPFAIDTFNYATKYWTVGDKNLLTIGYSGILLWNRVIWMSVGAAAFLFGYSRFRFEDRRQKRTPAELADETPSAVPRFTHAAAGEFGPNAQLAQLLGTFRIELKRLVRTPTFIVIAIAGLLNVLPGLLFSATEAYGNSSFPVTYWMIDLIVSRIEIFLLALITYYAGTLVWEERDTRTAEVYDALPSRNWIIYTGKLAALLGAIAIIQFSAMIAGIVVQSAHGYHRYQLGLYLRTLFVGELSGLVFYTILAFFMHVVMPNKYLGYFAYIAVIIANLFIWQPLHVGSLMVQFAVRQPIIYSDFYGYDPYLKEWFWFTLYWGAVCFLLAVTTVLLWRRGTDEHWRHRLHQTRLRFHGPLRSAAFAGLALVVAIGGWVYYNTEILNITRSQYDFDHLQADYEKAYKKYEHLPQPRVTDVEYTIDLYPDRGAMVMRGDETVKNKSTVPLDQIHFSNIYSYLSDVAITVPAATLVTDDRRLRYQIYRLDLPMKPGESRVIHFTVTLRPRGFENWVNERPVVQNGTFFNNMVAPQIGYIADHELIDPNTRHRFGLKEKDRMPPLERNCTADCMNTYFTPNSDWVNMETTIGTSPNQIAIAPGSLQREWTENGRRYFQYKLDHYSLNFCSFMSAQYEVARRSWNGISIEVYYLKEHPWNVNRMLKAVEKSFDYYTRNFGPYPHKEARIIEFPRFAEFAQAFAGTMPYSESIGFIANLNHPDDIDFVTYAVAHEMAHQWWAHQVIGANMQGATSLSETLAQYSAMMVMEKEYGQSMMRKFLEFDMDHYLRSRGVERLKERPLLRVESSQGYIHYFKGSVVMYYLREMIGEEAVNRALRKVLAEYGYKDPPYPTSYALVDALAAETPPQFQYLLHDLFYDITLFSNRVLTASAHKRVDGKYDIKVEVETHKFKADEKGNETEVPVDDWIEVGALAAPPKDHKYGKVLYRERIHMKTGRATYTFVTDGMPDKAGIDPLLLLIDRVPDDNLVKVTLR